MIPDMPEDVVKAAREAAGHQRWIGPHEVAAIVACAIRAERERCAQIADAMADEYDVAAFRVTADYDVGECRGGERSANRIATAIRGEGNGKG